MFKKLKLIFALLKVIDKLTKFAGKNKAYIAILVVILKKAGVVIPGYVYEIIRDVFEIDVVADVVKIEGVQKGLQDNVDKIVAEVKLIQEEVKDGIIKV